MRILITLLLLAVSGSADECTDACDATLAEQLASCSADSVDGDWLCMAMFAFSVDACDYARSDCMATSGGDPDAQAICDSIFEACVVVALEQREACFAELEESTQYCYGWAYGYHASCIDQCEGPSTRRQTWGTVKVLY